MTKDNHTQEAVMPTTESKSPMVEFAERELEFLKDGDPMNERMRRHLLHMVEEFAKEGHSGLSASYAIALLDKLLRFEPLHPLTGEDDEWTEVKDGLYQNKRCFRVFKDDKGNAWDIDGRVFVQPNGAAYTSKDSRTPVTFPYTPKTVYVRVDDEGKPLDAYE